MADDGKETKPGCCQRLGQGFSNFGTFLYNGETGQVMGRSGESWLKIGVFYLIFYGFLAAFFSAMLTVFLSTLNDVGQGPPKLTQFLANKPGLNLIPKGASLGKLNDDKTIEAYKKSVKSVFDKYDGLTDGKCPDNSEGRGTLKCGFNSSLLGACDPAKTTDFGIKSGMPCVYVKINKVYGWVPKPSVDGSPYLNLKCSKQGDGVEVFPAGGFHIGSFPFNGEENFELPVVAVQINTTKTTSVVCELSGPGIEVSESSVPHRAFAKIAIS
jgi:sodium/potassium-transporting ATPase subunit beta